MYWQGNFGSLKIGILGYSVCAKTENTCLHHDTSSRESRLMNIKRQHKETIMQIRKRIE